MMMAVVCTAWTGLHPAAARLVKGEERDRKQKEGNAPVKWLSCIFLKTNMIPVSSGRLHWSAFSQSMGQTVIRREMLQAKKEKKKKKGKVGGWGWGLWLPLEVCKRDLVEVCVCMCVCVRACAWLLWWLQENKNWRVCVCVPGEVCGVCVLTQSQTRPSTNSAFD